MLSYPNLSRCKRSLACLTRFRSSSCLWSHPLKETLTEHTSTSSSTCISTRTRSMPRMSSRCVVVTHVVLIGEVKRDSYERSKLQGLNYMMDRLGGKQLRHWLVKPKFEKKLTVDQQAREEGYRFICGFGPKANKRSQFMEWTDEQVHMPGGKMRVGARGSSSKRLSTSL